MSLKAAEKTSDVVIPPLSPFVGTQNVTTQSTTPVPTLPTEDPCVTPSIKDAISDRQLEMLKDHIRQIRGMQVSSPLTRKRTAPKYGCKISRIVPRTNETSRIRAEIRRFRLIQQCGEFFKHHTGQKSKVFSGDKPLTAEQIKTLVNEAKHLTPEEIFIEKQRAEAEYLRYLASKVRTDKSFRQNRASEFRFKHTRGEPVISSYYENVYNFAEKPPFFIARRYRPLPVWKLPVIDKEKEMWFIPQENQSDIPLYLIPQEKSKPKQKKRKELKNYQRHKRVPRHTSKVPVTQSVSNK